MKAAALISELASHPALKKAGETALKAINANRQLPAAHAGELERDFSHLMQNKPALKALAAQVATHEKPVLADDDHTGDAGQDPAQLAQQWLAQLLVSAQGEPLPTEAIFKAQQVGGETAIAALPATLLPGIVKQALSAVGQTAQSVLPPQDLAQHNVQSTANSLSSADKNQLVAMMQSLLQQQTPAAVSPSEATPAQQAQATLVSALDIKGLHGSAPKASRLSSPRQSDRPVLQALGRDKALNTAALNDEMTSAVAPIFSTVRAEDRSASSALPVITATLDPQREDWDQQLFSLLKDRIQVQMDGLHQTATIRLDPPSQGKIDISIQFEAGKLMVNINAGQADVYRALQQLSESLRHQLTAQNFVQVHVQVSTGDQSQSQQQQHSARPEQENSVSNAQEIAPSSTEAAIDTTLITKV